MSTCPDHIVAIGASAGGLIPLQELVESLPQDLGNTAIVVAQHLSPEYKSMLAEIISRKTSLPVTSIVDGEPLESNHIYVTPPNCDAVFKNNHLNTVETTIGGPRPNIDRLFSSMARVYKNKSTGIILSGTGHDGSNGITQVKNAGGLTISQDIKSAKYTGMPQAAINTGNVDVVLTPGDIGGRLLDLIYADRPIKIEMAPARTEDSFEQGDDITQLLRMLEHRLGTNFNNYKSSTVLRRIEKRLKELHFTTVKQYLGYINQFEEELDSFYGYLLIGVTSFFRDQDAFNALTLALKENVQKIASRGSLRIWVPGCATGEESVSIAIMVNELFTELNRFDIKLQIFATDINSNALKIARRGIYDAQKVEQLPDNIIDKYFIKDEDRYDTKLDIKNSILYTRHDLTSNPPFLRLDMISCRNLFIYFNQDLQNQLFPVFQYSLNKDGLLFLGKSESVGNFKTFFDTLDPKFRIFRKRNIEQTKLSRMPLKKPVVSEKIVSTGQVVSRVTFSVQDMVKETLFTTYDKPYIVIDEHSDIVEISGDINPFVSIKAGAANINLLKLIKEELHLELRTLVLDAVGNKKNVSGRLRRLKASAGEQLMRMQVQPLYFSKPGTSYFMVIFDCIDIDEPFFNSGNATESLTNADSKRIEELEFELQSNRQHMNTLVQELETTNEELQALNEELQSSNEEMQASNEELETSNEELQATNEELENAYVDLRSVTAKLSRQKQMMEQVSLASPDLIAILRGEDLIYEFINPAYQQLFPKKKIIGNALTNTMPEMASQGFYDLLQEVRKTKKTIQKNEALFELDYNDNGKKEIKYFNFTYAPLISEDVADADVIVYAVDVTDAVVMRNNAEENARFFSTLAESMPQKVWVASKDGMFSYINQTFKDYFSIKDFHSDEIKIDQYIHPDDLEHHKDAWKASLNNKDPYKIQYRLKAPGENNYHWHLCDCRPLLDQHNEANTWICTAIDIHEEKLIERKKDEFMSIASHELKTPLTTINGYIQLLEEVLKKEDCETALVYTRRTNKALNKITALVADLLDITRIETGKLRFTKQLVDFDKLVTETIEDFRPLANAHELIIEGGKTRAQVSADSGRMSQVIINLLSNAIKYSPDADKIVIKTFLKNKKVYFEVSDFGIGIPHTYLDKVFDRFFRVNEKNSFDSGLGIGLFITKEIILRHNGNISVTANDKKGSTFTFQLPIV